MKKLFLGIFLSALLISACFAGADPQIRATNDNCRTIAGYKSIQLSAVNMPVVTSSATVFYLDNVGGAKFIDFYVTGVSTGSAITTASMVPAYADGTAVTTAQTLTSGTDLTAIKSAFYKMSIPAASVTRNVSLNVIVSFY